MSQPASEFQNDWGPPRRKVVSWYDPAILEAAVAELPGREFLDSIAEGRLPVPPMGELVGARLESVEYGEVRFRCTPDESVYNTLGIVQGGFLCTVLDFAAGAAVHSVLPVGVGLASIEIKVSYLKPLRAGGDEVDVLGKTVRVGTRVAFAEASAHTSSGEIVAHATSSIALLRGESDQ